MNRIWPRRPSAGTGVDLTGAGAVAVGASVANVLGYILTVAGARLLGPEEFGAFGALLALVIVGNVAAMAAQATSARATARSRAVTSAVQSGLGLSVVVTLGLGALSPLLAAFLQLGSLIPPVAAAVAIGALTATAPALGVVQGRERFRVLGVLIGGQAGLRVAGGLIGMAIRPTAAAALVGMATGLAIAGIGAWAVARPHPHVGGTTEWVRSVRTTMASGGMLLGFVVLSNADVFLARHVLPAQASGLYAAGSVFTKIAFWLPQFVPLVAFPALTNPRRRRGAMRLGLLALLGSGGIIVAGAALLAEPAVAIVVGSGYEDLTPWIAGFTALGALLAIAQLLVYAHLATGDKLTIAVVWSVLVAFVAVVEFTAHGLGGVLFPALAAAGLVVLWGLAREGAGTIGPAPAPARVTQDGRGRN